jgi:hypothetical protein
VSDHDDSVRALLERLSDGTFDAEDIATVRGSIIARGVPESEWQRRRGAALRNYPEATESSAREILLALIRYAGTAWHRHQNKSVVPAEIAGTATEYLWKALKSGAIRRGEVMSLAAIKRALK